MYLLFIKFYLFSKKGYENCKNMKLKNVIYNMDIFDYFFKKKIEKRSWNENWILILINQEQNWSKQFHSDVLVLYETKINWLK